MGTQGDTMRWAVMMTLAGACAARPTTEALRDFVAMPPDLAGHLLVAEGETGPARADLHPYIRQRPLVRITGSHDLLVFGDGVVFVESERGEIEETGYRRFLMAGERLSALRKELAKVCPTLARSQTYFSCTHARQTVVSCHLDSADHVGRDFCGGRGDDEGRRVFAVADRLVEMTGARSWPDSKPTKQDWYTRDDIQKTLSPVTWKLYAPHR